MTNAEVSENYISFNDEQAEEELTVQHFILNITVCLWVVAVIVVFFVMFL